MKKPLFLIFSLLACTTYGQQQPLQSITWVSDNVGTLRFFGENHLSWELDQSFKSYPRFLDIDFTYYFSNDTLVVVNPYPEALYPDEVKSQVLYKFIIARKGNKLLGLTPVNDDAKRVIPQPTYVLRNADYVDDASVKFTSIHLNMGGCHDKCLESTVNIDNKGNYYLKILSNGYRSQANYFKGKLSAAQLDSLNYLVRHSEIKKLKNWTEKIKAADGGEWNFIIAYNSDVLKIKTSVMPGITRDLIDYSGLLASKLTLEPDERRHEFKQEGDLNYYK